MNVAGGDLNWISSLNDSQFQASINRMEQSVNRATLGIQSQGNQIEIYASKAQAAVAAFFSVQAATGFVSSLVDVRSQFQQLDIAFSTMLKSKAAADVLMKELITFAGTTPFGLKDAAGAAKQLLAYGSTAKTVVGELRMLGDVASGVSVPIGDLVYLYGTLKTQGRAYAMDIRQFAGRGIPIYAELAKVLKVGKDEVAGMVEAGKVGFPQVEQAFKNMTAAGGMFGGLMEAQSKAWAGQIERFKDAWDVMLNDIGKSQEGLFAGGIAAATSMVENYKDVLDILGLMIYSYGAYRAAIIAYAVAQRMATASVVVHGLSVRQLGVIETLVAGGKRVLISLQATYNAVLAASPIGATVALLASLGAVIYALTQYVDAAEASQERFNRIQDEGGVTSLKEANNIKNLVVVIKSQTATTEQRSSAYKKLQDATKGVLIGFSQEEIAAGKATDAIQAYIKSIKEATVAKTAFNEFQKLNDQLAELEVKGISAISMMDKAALRAKGLGKYINYSIGGYPESQKQDFIDSKNIFLNGKAGNDAILKQQKANLEQQLKDLTGKYGKQITGELTKTSDNDAPIVASKKRTVDAIDAEIKKLKEEQNAVSETSAQYANYKKQITKLEDEKARITGKQSGAQKKEISDREKFLNKLAELEQEAFRKSLTKNEEEIKAAQDKAEELRKEARKNGLGAGVVTRIDNIEIKETGNIKYRQDTELLETELDKQKQLYLDYEDYKSKLGKDAADNRFKSELDVSVNYLQRLEAERAKILETDPTKMSGPELERLSVLDKQINDEVKLEKKKYDDLVQELISYEQERRLLTEKYNSEFAQLEETGTAEQRAELTKQYKENLNTLDDSHVKQLDSYKVLYEGIDRLSDDNARKVIANARVMLAEQISSGKISKELAKELEKLIKDSERSLSQRLPDNLINIANQIDGIANAVGGVDSMFGKVLGTLGNVLGQVGNIKKGMDSFKEAGAKGDVLGQLGAGLGMVGAGISIFKSVFSLFDRSQQREEQAAYARDLQNKQAEALNKSLERQIALLNDAYGTDRMVKYNEAINQATANEAKYQEQLKGRYQLTGDKTIDKYLEKLNSGEWKLGGDMTSQWLRKIIEGTGIGNMPTEISSLQKLLDEGRLDAGTSTIVQNLIKAREAAAQLKNQLNAENVGSSLGQIADDFIKTLTDGTQDFGKSFEDTIRTSLMNGFKGKLIEEQLQAFYTQFATLSTGGLTDKEIETLRTSYTTAAEKAKKDIEDLEKATGIKLTGDSKTEDTKALTPNTLTASLNQQTGERLEGLWRGQFDLTKQMNLSALEILNIAKSNFDTALKIEANTFRTANNTDNLIRLTNIENTLASIDKKTGAKTTRD